MTKNGGYCPHLGCHEFSRNFGNFEKIIPVPNNTPKIPKGFGWGILGGFTWTAVRVFGGGMHVKATGMPEHACSAMTRQQVAYPEQAVFANPRGRGRLHLQQECVGNTPIFSGEKGAKTHPKEWLLCMFQVDHIKKETS